MPIPSPQQPRPIIEKKHCRCDRLKAAMYNITVTLLDPREGGQCTRAREGPEMYPLVYIYTEESQCGGRGRFETVVHSEIFLELFQAKGTFCGMWPKSYSRVWPTRTPFLFHVRFCQLLCQSQFNNAYTPVWKCADMRRCRIDAW